MPEQKETYLHKRNVYIKNHATCKNCDVKSCTTRIRVCPYFQPNEAFTRVMLPALGVTLKGPKRK